jgi:hypothetical protein
MSAGTETQQNPDANFVSIHRAGTLTNHQVHSAAAKAADCMLYTSSDAHQTYTHTIHPSSLISSLHSKLYVSLR